MGANDTGFPLRPVLTAMLGLQPLDVEEQQVCSASPAGSNSPCCSNWAQFGKTGDSFFT